MLKKAIAAVAVAGSLFVLAPQAALAGETPSRPGTATGTTTDAKADAAAKEALAAIEQRVADDPALARQLGAAAEQGDTALASKLLASEGAEVVEIGSQPGDAELARVTIRVTVTVCVRVYGTVYCATITVTVNVD